MFKSFQYGINKCNNLNLTTWFMQRNTHGKEHGRQNGSKIISFYYYQNRILSIILVVL